MQLFFPLGDIPEGFGEVVAVTITVTKSSGSSTTFGSMRIIQSEPEDDE